MVMALVAIGGRAPRFFWGRGIFLFSSGRGRLAESFPARRGLFGAMLAFAGSAARIFRVRVIFLSPQRARPVPNSSRISASLGRTEAALLASSCMALL